MAANPGDIAFIGFNADVNDGFAIVTLKAIDGSSTPVHITFTDNEWDGTNFTATEGELTWTLSSLISAGTVVAFSSVSSSPTVSVGTISNSAGNMNLAGDDEAIYALTGTTGAPTSFLAAITNDDFAAAGASLTNTGLVLGTTAIELDGVDADADIAVYTGSRSGDRTSLLTAIHNPTNWQTQDGSGDQSNDTIAPDLPFDTTPFTIPVASLAIAATDANKLEGDSGNTTFTFTVTRSGDTSSTTTVDYATADGTAIAGDDHIDTSGTLAFNASETTKTITVNVIGDTTAESDETFTVTLSNASGGATISSATASGTIQDDDSTPPSPILPPPAPDPDPDPSDPDPMVVGLESPTTPPPPPTTATTPLIPSLTSNPTVGGVTSDGIPVAEATPLLIESTSGTFAQDTFTLSNAGSSPLQIQGVTPQFAEGVLPAGLNPEDVFVIEPSGGTVPPGETLTVRVLLRDDLLPGTYGGTLAIATNDPTNPTIPVPITGSVELPRARLVASIRGAELPTNTPVWTPEDDILIGAELPGNRDQWLNGGAGDDLIFGNQGRDVLTGGPGQDTLLGGRGEDFLRGADGDDVLFGDRGDDILQGNGGADSFVLAAGFGSDVILDFEEGRDRILLTSPLTFASLMLQDQGNSTQILSGTEVLATVVGVDSSLLTAADFAAL